MITLEQVYETLDNAEVEYNDVYDDIVDCCSDEDARKAYKALTKAKVRCAIMRSEDEYTPDCVVLLDIKF